MSLIDEVKAWISNSSGQFLKTKPDLTGTTVTVTEDKSGSLLQFADSVTVAINLPTTAGNIITEALIRCASDQPQVRVLEYSFDGGATYGELTPGEFVGWAPRGNKTQVNIRGKGGNSTDYEVIINRVP